MKSEAIDLVDFHCHILPGADHGSSSVETSLFQLSEAKAHGVKRIIATPHFYPTSHKLDSFLDRRNTAYLRLCESLGSDMPRVKLGAEVLICDGIEELPGLERLCVNGTKTLLLELPFSTFNERYCDSVYTLCNRGFDVVIAHADRYNPTNIEMLVDNGARIQLNADSLDRLFMKKTFSRWLEKGIVIALGSDMHGNDKLAYQHFVKAQAKIGRSLLYVKRESDKIFDSAKEI